MYTINELGIGFLESVYERALVIVLSEQGFKAKNQFPSEDFIED